MKKPDKFGSAIESCITMLSFNDNDLVREARAELAALTEAQAESRPQRPYDMSIQLDRNDAGWLSIDQHDEPNGLLGNRIWLVSKEQFAQVVEFAKKEMGWLIAEQRGQGEPYVYVATGKPAGNCICEHGYASTCPIHTTTPKEPPAPQPLAAVEHALIVARLKTIGMAGEFGGNTAVVARIRELEYTDHQAREYIQNAQSREHLINELESEAAQLRESLRRIMELAHILNPVHRPGLMGKTYAWRCEACGRLAEGEMAATRIEHTPDCPWAKASKLVEGEK